MLRRMYENIQVCQPASSLQVHSVRQPSGQNACLYFATPLQGAALTFTPQVAIPVHLRTVSVRSSLDMLVHAHARVSASACESMHVCV